jgi:hypothetical protein
MEWAAGQTPTTHKVRRWAWALRVGAGLTRTDRDVMRQALLKMVGILCVVLAAAARGDGPPAADEPPIARARRLIQAGDRATALEVLEDALIDGPARDKPAVVDLLRQSYEALAREAESAGRTSEAARYRDNLSILQQGHASPRPSPAPTPRVEPPKPKPALEPTRPKPRVEPAQPKPRVVPAPATGRPREPGKFEPSTAAAPEAMAVPPPSVMPLTPSGQADIQAPPPDPSLSEPAPLAEPGKLPKPGPILQIPPVATGPEMTPIPRSSAPIGATPQGMRGIPFTTPAASMPNGLDGGAVPLNPGDATPATAPAEAATTQPSAGSMTESRPRIDVSVSRAAATATEDDSTDLARADRLFREQQYDGSGRIYAALAERNMLPKERRPHWAYCRFKAVVSRINAGPRSAQEWDVIVAEIRSIQRLTPENWYADYLLNKVAEARRTRRWPAASSDGMVVRGSAPDDPSPSPQEQAQNPARRRGLFGRSRGASTTPVEQANPAEGLPNSHANDQPLNLPGALSLPEASAGDGSEIKPRNEGASKVSGASGSDDTGAITWQVHETPNFRIYHCDPALAERAAAVAESVRAAQAKRWKSSATRAPWTPRCDLYLYPTARTYAEATGQPEMSPGLSTLSNNGVRILSRRMNLRADNPLLLTATLPHEITHIVLADLFIAQPIPRWADEGIAVLAEPATEQRLRQSDLKEPLDAGNVFQVGKLMTMDCPNAKDWRLFYAQSVSLTLFLVEQGPPERFIQFVLDSQRMGAEAALRDVYHIDGLSVLHERWLDYARKHVTLDVATGRDVGQPDG